MASRGAPFRNRLTILGALLGSLCLAVLAGASTRLPLEPDASDALPRVEVSSAGASVTHLTFELPALEVEDYPSKDGRYQTVVFGQSELFGEPGEPALPAFTRYVSLPPGSGAILRVLAVEEETFAGYRLLPMQPDKGTSFCINDRTYAQDEFLGGQAVELGSPAVMRGLRVIPVTWRPVSYNPARGEIRVLRRIEVAVEFTGKDLRNESRRAAVPRTKGFGELGRSFVLDYPRESASRSDLSGGHLGTWLIISRNTSSVLTELVPLVAWRQQQGYNVVQVTTTQTGTSPAQIKDWIQEAYDTWEDPPEYIVLVGDYDGDFSIGSFEESYSGHNGMGDHPYVQLDGEDDLPDAFIGRLSARTTSQLRLIVHKIVSYETNPYVGGRDWFSRACLVGDIESISAITCRQVQQWVKERLVQLGYTAVDTVWYSPYSQQMEASVRRGVSYFGYRGYYGMSGWDTGDIYATRNGRGMMPFAVNLTCDTGTWYEGTSRSEAWLLAGTYPDSLKGGVASIGTATPGTATRYNNCFYAGVAYGLFWEDHYQTGPAHARGKVEMAINYGTYQPTVASTYCYWNTLIGDPATEIWTAWPQALTVNHAASVPLGTNQLSVAVTGPGGAPVAGAWVHLFREGLISDGASTDAAGVALLPLDGSSAGTVQVTVSGHNLYPYRGSLTVQQQSLFVGFETCTVDDGQTYGRGNGDGALNPGEQVGLAISLHNFGTQTVHDVYLTAATDDPDVALIAAGPVSFGDIAAGATAAPDTGLIAIRVQPAMPNGREIVLALEVHAGAETWPARLELPVSAPDLVSQTHALTGCGALLDPGESAQLSVTLRNDGAVAAAGPVEAYLMSDAYMVTVTDPHGTFPATLEPGNSGTNGTDSFGIASPADCVAGLLAHLRLALTFADGVRDTAQLLLPVGTAQVSDPTGPDAHGYFIYGEQDTEYPDAPVYNWLDITSLGTEVGLDDYAFEEDDVVVVTLPFPFTFYGETFERASICSNGWISMGSTYLNSSRNWYLPGAEGPASMIAVFWDDMYQHSEGNVYHWYDAANHRYVVAWDNLYNNACYLTRESCEAILYDPAYYPTDSGDGVIVLQFKKVNQVDLDQNYATCGIQNGDHTIGLTYSYYNHHPASGYWLLDGTALTITTGGPGAASAHTLLDAPPRLLLAASEPNPCRSSATIRFVLDRARPVALRVFDLDGRLVRTLLSGPLASGEHAVQWSGCDERGRKVPGGMYFYRLETGGESASRRLLLIP